ncbi:hypothetical protein CAPTEDRAFT_225292 [Capitella teleta]|uniref:Kinesin motor domain-containing protein n=1 Tax=Capitella teleta TaxID=283909 RepID=R7TXY0_CAPTE|nr:hypothetical protein CAPTEDRAFT_225292 [Capitella teleta]|eukprot:ELT98482.1 hypothetical protein CAPTEDRAFT_225292 [Capitella teleta]
MGIYTRGRWMKVSGEKVSKMSLVDLAGSERAQKTGAVGDRLKEGSNINKSLTTLGLVISHLADQSGGKSKNKFVPYRDSVLTWLLKDNLGGNSKTVMLATLSPSADNYEETLSTLRYADRAKRIVNHAVVNEDPNARIIRELREEVDSLRKMLDEAQIIKSGGDLQERLQESEKLMKDMSKTWEQKLQETEQMHKDRHAALEKMGISVETSGIKVEYSKYFLVNLNADPSLNELLVYYLKDHTRVGRHDAAEEQDIKLAGIGIMPEHCKVQIDNAEVHVTPLDGARTCVNGREITAKTKLKHGDRLLWGNNHFFRVNCPKAHSPSSEAPNAETPECIDYDFAQQELMQQQNDPISEAINVMELQHEEDKQEALDRQRQMYERQMELLRTQLMSPSTPSAPYPALLPFDPFKMTPTGVGSKYQQWVTDRDKLFKQSLKKLKEEVVRANALVREANFLALEMCKQTEYSVTLQIPAANLSPNRKRGAFVSEPAILVKRRNKGSQVWSMEKFENKIIDMRDLYEDCKEKGVVEQDSEAGSDSDEYDIPLLLGAQEDTSLSGLRKDPFFELQENHNLIGVANVYLNVLFYDVKLEYQVPIVSQQGEVAGRLHVELTRLTGAPMEQVADDTSSEGSNDSRPNSFIETEEEDGLNVGSSTMIRVAVKEAKGLPPALANFVFCQYDFWGCEETVVPPVVGDVVGKSRKNSKSATFKFDHEKDFKVVVNDEFLEHCSEGALSIEVWGHHSMGFGSSLSWEMEQVQAKSHSIMDRWDELTRKMELCVEIHELSEQGEYAPVEVMQRTEVLTGGVYQLRQKGLDSYQEEDLGRLRQKWNNALDKRREHLDEQLKRIMNKEEKKEADSDRERSLIDQWVVLTEERNAVLVPAAGSGIPGAPADWEVPPGMEDHIPVIFLDMNAEDMGTPKENLQEASGVKSILPKEYGAKFFTLPFVKNSDKDCCSVVSWDSSIHDSVHLNRVTPPNERVYLILKVGVRLSHPAVMDLVLRKRICINVYKRQSITEKLKKRIGKAVNYYSSGDYLQDNQFSTGVTYEIVSNIPKASEDLEDRESLAQMAASHNDRMPDGETYIDKYIEGVSAVESILNLDKLRQEVAIKELLALKGRPLRKATSVPNIHNLRADSTSDLRGSGRSSVGEIERYGTMPKHYSLDSFRSVTGSSPNGAKDQPGVLPNKPQFNLARPNFLNLRTNIYSANKPSTKGMSPAQPPQHKQPLTTLVEEQKETHGQPLEEAQEEEEGEATEAKEQEEENPDELKEEEAIPNEEDKTAEQKDMSHSCTSESLVDVPSSRFTTSMASSGYGSQAQSLQTLSSSDDGASVKSISIDETPDTKAEAKLQREESLIDTEVPDNLDSPLKPTTPAIESIKSDVYSDKALDELEGLSDHNDTFSTPKKDDELRPKSQSAGERNGGKTGPMKATYRPASMVLDSDDGDESKMPKIPSKEDLSDNEDTMSICSFGSRADLHRLGESPMPSWVKVGEAVLVLFSHGASKPGVIQFIGCTEFAAGNWVGVELESADGKNDGSVKGVRYFKCRKRHGVFVRHDKLIMDKKRRNSGRMKPGSPSTRKSTGNLAAAAASPRESNGGAPIPSFMKATASSTRRK